MLKVGVVGCGKIADSHASQIKRVTGCEIVGAADREFLMAKQFCERYGVKQCFDDLAELLDRARPDVVHVTTPPESHFAIARFCLERGCHVYVEKPFTLCEDEARALLELAGERNLKITVGHDDQFTHVARRMRSLVQTGFLGDGTVHMESYYGYVIGRAGYAGALLGDKAHWVRRLPGGLMQNVISHGVARIAEFLTTETPYVLAHGFTSPLLKSMGESEIIDELRVIISDRERCTAYFTFSSQMRPSLHQFRVFGSRNGLVLDHDNETLIKLRGAPFKSYAERFLPPLVLSKQYAGNVLLNMRTFLRKDFHMKAGMKHLIECFYRAIIEDSPVPISYREILLTARLMDSIFSQVCRGQFASETDAPAPAQSVGHLEMLRPAAVGRT